MNRKIFILTILMVLSGFNLSADNGNGKNEKWVDAMIKAKCRMQAELKRNKMPVASPVVELNKGSETFSLDISGSKVLVLTVNTGPAGRVNDWGVWGNARITKKDGSVVYLDQLKYRKGYGAFNTPLVNKNLNGNTPSVGNKKFEHAMFCHAFSQMVYDLPENAVKFDAEVGIDNESKGGKAFFEVSNVYPDDFVKYLTSNYAEDLYTVLPLFGNNLENWLKAPINKMEKSALEGAVKNLKDGTFFAGELAEVNALEDEKERTAGYLSLMKRIQKVSKVQEKLEWLNFEAVCLAYKDMSADKKYNIAKYGPIMEELKQLVAKGFNGIYKEDPQAYADIVRALECKKEILLGHPALDADKIVASRFKVGVRARNIMAPDLGTPRNNWSEQGSAARSGFDADIVELSDLRGDVNIRSVYKPSNTSSIADLRLHWDGEHVLFSQTCEDQRWNVHEVKLDGTGFRKIIENEEPDLDFYDGCYLPDGRFLAVSNIGYQGVPCVNGSSAVGNLVLYTPETKNLRRLTFDQDANWNPTIMNNGRVMYSRWEYTDLTHYYSRIVMHMNPDGTENKALYGSGSMFPNSTYDVQPLPGYGSAFVGIISGHHGIARSGRMIIFDPTKGRKNVYGMVQEIPHRNVPIKEEIKDQLVNGVWPQFVKPMPIDDKYFLVAAKLSPDALWGIYLVDVFDNVTCIKEMEGEGFISPTLVRKKEVPPVIPDKVKLNEKEATFFIQDIYEGEGLKGIPRGTVKYLRLHAYEYAYVKTASDHNWHGIQSGWDIKRNLGTVPVEEDGSVIFKAPANTPISIQPIDEEGVAVQWMRSWVVGQPGEVVSCVGCHEDQNYIAIPKRVIASQKTPKSITPPKDGIRSFTFDLEIQPILDRACIACHNGEGKAFDLRGGKKGFRDFGTSYLNFHPYVRRQGGEGDMAVLKPYEYHPNTSELVRMLKKGHYGVQLKDEEWKTLYNWIDYNAPDKGYFNANVLSMVPYKGFDQIARRKELTDKYANGAGVDWKKEIADYAAKLKARGPIVPVKPDVPKPYNGKDPKIKNWPLSTEQIKAMIAQEGTQKKEVEIADGIKVTFVRIPAGEFIMGSNCGDPDAHPTAKVRIEKAFWMSELETTNEQFNVIFPEHDSKFVDQQWKDHVKQGYPANEPDQPVIRVSYNDVMTYCQKLSEKTGLNITLPTEAQWEWACRAGSDQDFWYGGMNADFGTKDNLADKTSLQFAVAGVDPKPMSPGSVLYEMYTYLPKEESVDDKSLIQVAGKVYEANPFGLYNMHGNVAEWTRSDYLPYPYKEKSKETSKYKVVRGGSYFERPKYSTSHTRKFYYPYQSVFNVGFRMIIED